MGVVNKNISGPGFLSCWSLECERLWKKTLVKNKKKICPVLNFPLTPRICYKCQINAMITIPFINIHILSIMVLCVLNIPYVSSFCLKYGRLIKLTKTSEPWIYISTDENSSAARKWSLFSHVDISDICLNTNRYSVRKWSRKFLKIF